MVKLEHSPNGYVVIHLADDEWGNEKMEQIAREYFDSEPSCNFVQVYEHGGWSLGWRRDGSIWSTANDMAKLRKANPRPERVERVIRRDNVIDDVASDYWMLEGKSYPAWLKVAS